MKNLRLLFLFVFVLTGCNKEPGQGGSARISGKVYRIETNVLGQVLAEYYDTDRDVYILYGTDDQIYDDKFSTSWDGSYEFTSLTRGTYTIFAYTRCDTCKNGETIASQTVEVTDKKGDYVLDDLVTFK